ncbi:acyl-CoA carboxylase subunit epsilon [Amycolatopsis cynarae]|uniref:Acyl-CoA carboxylase subunit epsilon n=1 Tax=Amycolatopsis cynarae TaxID=2995223 RepID=A0ABY7B7H9_9PSEU|nr:acyl-CoA carboxylase subunit epsilon [Amycolatopsis sp. HUAS 11-8]WAL67932.1 acyl-CoA carboxylase subunit epsilon [Amycolatopsis sp. HUAS 11-8]
MSEPRIRVLRGAPDDDELAALIAVLSAISAAAGQAGPATTPTAARPASRRLVPFPSATSWRTPR